MKTILVKRRGALGDVLLTTPIVRRLHEEGWKVFVQTVCPEVFKNSPYVEKVIPWNQAIVPQHFKKIVNLDLCYERTPKKHIIDAYSRKVFGDEGTPKMLGIYPTEEDRKFAVRCLRPYTAQVFSPAQPLLAVLHMATSWENRTWSTQNWMEVAKGLSQDNFWIVSVGENQDRFYASDNTIDLVGDNLSIQELYSIIDLASVFIGSDSGILHIAQTTSTPCIGIYTCAKAEYRATTAFPIVPDLDCYGCLHDEVPPVTYCGCRRGDFACLTDVTPNKVIDKVKEIFV